MLVYFDAETGAIKHTITMAGGLAPPPGDYIEVPDATPVDGLAQCVIDGELVARASASDAQREQALEQITRRRGEMRQRFITPLPGQDMVYLEKRSEAVAFLAHEAPTPALFPMVFAEIGITAATAEQVAQVWLNMNDLWRAVSTLIEAATLKASGLVATATTPGEIDAALAEMEITLGALDA